MTMALKAHLKYQWDLQANKGLKQLDIQEQEKKRQDERSIAGVSSLIIYFSLFIL
jgi:hypothetical protein